MAPSLDFASHTAIHGHLQSLSGRCFWGQVDARKHDTQQSKPSPARTWRAPDVHPTETGYAE